ncbi:MAG: ornithine cyclodeaminase family protein [Boseongicola sp.]
MIHTGTDHIYLPDSALESLGIEPPEVADAIEAALRAKSDGRLHTTPKSAILPGDGRYMMSTLAVGDDGLVVLKAVGVYPGNAARDLDAINGAVIVMDAETGLLRAVMGANWITAVRTAALSAVAARRLANPAAETVAFVGCGIQASSHLAAFMSMFPLKKIYAVGRGAANVARLCEEAKELGLEAEGAIAEDALRQVDLVVSSITLDYSVTPFLEASWLKPGAFATITDLFIPWTPDSAEVVDTIVVDDLEQERTSEKPMVPPDRITDDLTGLIGRGDLSFEPDKVTAFAFRGLALGDYAAAALALRKAEATGAGQRIGARP